MKDSKHSTVDESKDKDTAAYLKRREQVRRAQRSHRERKEAYVKSLENEILQQRKNEAKIHKEKEQLQIEVEKLKSILDQHGIAYGSPSTYSSPSPPLGNNSGPDQSFFDLQSRPYHQPAIQAAGSQNNGEADFYISGSDGGQSLESITSPRLNFPFFGDSEIYGDGSTMPIYHECLPVYHEVLSGSARRNILRATEISDFSTPESTLSMYNIGMDFDFSFGPPYLSYSFTSQTSVESAHSYTGELHLQTSTQPLPSPTLTTLTSHPGTSPILDSQTTPFLDQPWYQTQSQTRGPNSQNQPRVTESHNGYRIPRELLFGT